MSNFSKPGAGKTQTAIFKKHHPHEVVEDLTHSKQVANAYQDTNRYQHRAQVTVVGHATLRPYDPIYLDGLPNGLSGYWTVLSVQHVFGGDAVYYAMNLEVGTDILGDVNLNAQKQADLRDVQSDFTNQSLTDSPSKLTEYSLSPNSVSLIPYYGLTSSTAVKNTSQVSVPNVSGATPFKSAPPNIGGIKQTVKWSATSSGKVVR
jgi:hypothetical protein